MKAADYRIPWGRPSEHLLAVKREIIGQQLHVRRVHDARNRSTIDTEPPECAHMPHLVTRPKKKKMQEDRQREIAAENYSLMHRLAGIMKEERGDPVKKFSHLSVEYRESLRRKKLLKLEWLKATGDDQLSVEQAENRRLARSIRNQKPFYPNQAMEKEEEERQALLKTMSRAQRRKERVAVFKATAAGLNSTSHHRHVDNSRHKSAATMTASLVEDGVLFRPGPTAVRLRTAKQMQQEVARRRHGGGGGGEDDEGEDDEGQEYFSSGSGDGNGAAGSLMVKRRGHSIDGNAATKEQRGVVLEVNRTGGGRRRRSGSGGGYHRAASGEGRPNMIFTPSLVPVGLESVRAHPMTLGNEGGRGEGSARLGGHAVQSAGGDSLAGEAGEQGVEEFVRDTRTV